MPKEKLYKVHIKKPEVLTLHFANHEITVNNLASLPDPLLLHDVKQVEMDELFRAGIVLMAVEEEIVE